MTVRAVDDDGAKGSNGTDKARGANHQHLYADTASETRSSAHGGYSEAALLNSVHMLAGGIEQILQKLSVEVRCCD